MTENDRSAGFHWPEEDPTERAREAALPDHETDRDTSVGAGVVAASGTSTDTEPAARARTDPAMAGRAPGDAGGVDDGRRDDDDRPVIEEPGKIQLGGRSG